MFKAKFNPNPKKFHCIPLYTILKKKKKNHELLYKISLVE